MSAQSPRPSDDRTRRGAGRPARGGLRTTVKGPLVFSAVLGLVGGSIAALTASGGTDNPLRIDIGLIAFGARLGRRAFVVAAVPMAGEHRVGGGPARRRRRRCPGPRRGALGQRT